MKSKVIVAMTSAMKRHPAVGWVRADKVPSEATLADILALRTRVAELEAQLSSGVISPPKGAEGLAQGEEQHSVVVSFVARDPSDGYPFSADRRYTGKVVATWNSIFGAIAPSMINEASDSTIRNELRSFFARLTAPTFEREKDIKGRIIRDATVKDEELDTCIVQLRALGLIRENQKPRSVKNTQTYWTLTPYGDSVMTQLRAIRSRTE